MTRSELETTPRCRVEGHGPMLLRPEDRQFNYLLGVWYDCERCHNSTLVYHTCAGCDGSGWGTPDPDSGPQECPRCEGTGYLLPHVAAMSGSTERRS